MKVLFLITLLVCCCEAAFAFQTSSLELNIIDRNLAAISNAVARIKREDIIVKEIKISEPRKLVFSNIKPGQYILEIEAPGFKTYYEEIEINAGNIQRTIKLEIAETVENVNVTRSNRDKTLDPKNGAFTNFLTKAEIDALPDDPELMKKALKQKFGDDAEFLVDGFSSKGLPRKSEIASIKVSQSSFDAEYHKIGISIIEITTKALNKFFGYLNFDFNDAALNAREPFSRFRYPEQNKSVELFLIGPVRKDKTSFSISAGITNSYNTAVVIAKLPNRDIDNSLKSTSTQSFFTGKIKHNLSEFQTINLVYSYNRNKSRNLGIGEFALPERAFSSDSQENQIRYSQIGNVGKRFYNEFRFQYGNETSRTIPVNNETAIIVLDAFSKGGAGNNAVNKQQNLSLADNLLWGIGNHALKIGGVLEYESQNTVSSENENGTFIFSDLNDFLSNTPTIFTQKTGNRNVEFSNVRFGAFIQDDFRLSKSLMLSLGLRYEWQNNLKDSNNFSPRIGFAWSPAQNGKTAFRGGIGIFYNWLESNTVAAILSQNEDQPSEIIIINPSFPNPFLSGINQILPKSYWQKSADLKNPYVVLGQFGIQRQISKNTSVSVQYTYQKVIHQFRSRDINAPINFVRPNSVLGVISQLESSAFFVGNSLKFDFKAAPVRSAMFEINYQLSKRVSDTGGILSLPSNNYNLQLDRAVSSNDQRHKIYSSFLWAVPNLRGVKFSANLYAGSPLPYTITTGLDTNGDTVFNDRPLGVLRNSRRGKWQSQTDMGLSWQFSLEKKTVKSSSSVEYENLNGRTLKLEINAENVFNHTNFTRFVGVQSSPFFGQSISADNPRRIKLGLGFSF